MCQSFSMVALHSRNLFFLSFKSHVFLIHASAGKPHMWLLYRKNEETGKGIFLGTKKEKEKNV